MDRFNFKYYKNRYNYEIDSDELSYSCEIGNKQFNEKYKLEELSDVFEKWRGYPQKTKKNMSLCAKIIIGILFLMAIGIVNLIFNMVLLLSVLLYFLYLEIGFLFPTEWTVVTFEDKEVALYILRTKNNEKELDNFEDKLKKAIRIAKQKQA